MMSVFLIQGGTSSDRRKIVLMGICVFKKVNTLREIYHSPEKEKRRLIMKLHEGIG
jgi:hypothetical protein